MTADTHSPFERAMNNPHPYVAAPHTRPRHQVEAAHDALMESHGKPTYETVAAERAELIEALRDVVSAHSHAIPTKEFNRRGGSWTVIRGKALDKAVKLLARIDAGKDAPSKG